MRRASFRKFWIGILKSLITNPERGLPEEVFLWVSSLTPMVNVDLLIRNKKGEVLLTWREKMFHFSPGWHIPGGIVRYKERMAKRIREVARSELGAEVSWKPEPLAIKELIIPDLKERGHFISFLFDCCLLSPPREDLRYRKGEPEAGQWRWFSTCPSDLLEVHRIYREFLPG